MRANPNDSITVPLGFIHSGERVTVRPVIGLEPLSHPELTEVADHLSALLRPVKANVINFADDSQWVILDEVQYTSSIENVEAVLTKLAAELNITSFEYSHGAIESGVGA